MDNRMMEKTAQHAMRVVDRFFTHLSEPEMDLVPSVLKSPGTWMANFDESTLAIFFLDEREQRRVNEYQEGEWPPFPGFFVSKGSMPAGSRAAFAIEGRCSFLSSIHTSNLFALEVSPGGSCITVNHFHEIRDSSGKEFKYQVALAFVLGIRQAEAWTDVEHRLSELLDHGMSVWRGLR